MSNTERKKRQQLTKNLLNVVKAAKTEKTNKKRHSSFVEVIFNNERIRFYRTELLFATSPRTYLIAFSFPKNILLKQKYIYIFR